jgi:hypothetical protein
MSLCTKYKQGLLLFILILVFPFKALAAIPGLEPEKSWDLGGYVKYMGTGVFPDSSGSSGGGNRFDNLLHQRFNLEYRFDSELRFNIGMRNRYIWGDTAKSPNYSEFVGHDTGFFDLSKNWGENDGRVGNTQLDRAYLDWKKNDWQLRGGRFRVNWGMTTIWNPNDVFNAYSVYDFDYEERPGTDALSVRKKLGFASEIDAVFSPDEEKQLNSFATRYLFNHREWDVQLIGGKARLDHFVGLGIAGEIRGAGVRAETSYFRPTHDSWQDIEQHSATVTSFETDYSFGGAINLLAKVALMHHSNPQEPLTAAAFLALPLSAKTLSFTEFTSYVDVSFDVTALNRMTLSNIYYQDGSYFWGLSNSYSMAEDWQLLAVLQLFDGSSDSLFSQSASRLVYGQIKWSF